MDDAALATAFAVARSAEQLSVWRPRDWPDLAVELLLADIDDQEVAELAGLPTTVTGWETDPLVASTRSTACCCLIWKEPSPSSLVSWQPTFASAQRRSPRR